jgi:hypothetical protein
MLALLSSLAGRGTRLMRVAAFSDGRITGQDVALDQRLEQLRSLLAQHPEFQAPRSRTLTPLVTETPQVVRGRNGGWINASHGSNNYAHDQPPKLEPQR